MSGQIISANVGAASGGNVVPMPQDPSYATWPDVAKKATVDILGILESNYEKDYSEGDPDYYENVPSGSTRGKGGNVTTRPVTGNYAIPSGVILIGAIILLLVMARGMKL